MKLKMFGKKGSAGQRASRVTRLIKGLGPDNSFHPSITSTPFEPKPFAVHARLDAAELERAKALMYQRMGMDRPR
ncbi:MAG: hypothetical protein PVF15_09155 [Candidatus Bathyarchaeota archaeon]